MDVVNKICNNSLIPSLLLYEKVLKLYSGLVFFNSQVTDNDVIVIEIKFSDGFWLTHSESIQDASKRFEDKRCFVDRYNKVAFLRLNVMKEFLKHEYVQPYVISACMKYEAYLTNHKYEQQPIRQGLRTYTNRSGRKPDRTISNADTSTNKVRR